MDILLVSNVSQKHSEKYLTFTLLCGLCVMHKMVNCQILLKA